MQTATGERADPQTRLGVQAQGGGRSATDALVVALACSPPLQAVLSASLKHSLHSFNSFLRPVEGIGLFMMLQLLKCMTNT